MNNTATIKFVIRTLIEIYHLTSQETQFRKSYAMFIQEILALFEQISDTHSTTFFKLKTPLGRSVAVWHSYSKRNVLKEQTTCSMFISDADYYAFIDAFSAIKHSIESNEPEPLSIHNTLTNSRFEKLSNKLLESTFYCFAPEFCVSNLKCVSNVLLMASVLNVDLEQCLKFFDSSNTDAHGNYALHPSSTDIIDHISATAGIHGSIFNMLTPDELLSRALLLKDNGTNQLQSISPQYFSAPSQGKMPLPGWAIKFDDYSWGTSSEFITSALVSYISSYGDFRKLKICQHCKKLCYPKRSGDNRGIFCSEKCRQAHHLHRYGTLANCIAKQRQFIRTRIDFLHKTNDIYSRIYNDNLTDVTPKIDTCRRCTAISSKPVDSGECPFVYGNKQILKMSADYYNEKVKLKGHSK